MKFLKITTKKAKNFLPLFILISFFSKMNELKAASFRELSGLYITGMNAGYSSETQKLSGETIIIQIINLVLTFVGVAFLILMIYGGITWMTAAGNDTKVDKAKKTIIAGVIGVIVVFSAYVISQFVVAFFTAQTLG